MCHNNSHCNDMVNNINDKDSSLFNFSQFNISNDLLQLLNKGIKFVPTPRANNSLQRMIHDMECFSRKVKLHYYFLQNDANKNTVKEVTTTKALTVTNTSLKGITQLKLPSRWTPPTIKLSKNKRLIITSILKLPYVIRPVNNKVNISKCQLSLLNELKCNKDIVVSAADKGGAMVLWNKSDYLAEGYRQLNDNVYYKRITTALTINNYDSILCILKRMRKLGQISQAQFSYLLRSPASIKQRKFYMLPKVHKPVEKWMNNNTPPGRPIVSDVNSESYFTAKLITILISSFPQTLLSYVKNSFEFKNRICLKPCNKNYILVTADIDSLYTNMNIDRCMLVTKKYLSTFLNESLTNNILKLLEINLKNNDFVFNQELFVQTYGVAMGKSFAPPLASLYLADFDHSAMTGFNIKPLYYTRYIDDVFFVWPGNEQQLGDFQVYLNGLLPGIKLSFINNNSSIDFLDTTVIIHNEQLITKVFFKPTDRHTLLARSSFHPQHTFRGILKSQFIRFKKLCFRKEDYCQACRTIIASLYKRGYKHRKMISLSNYIWQHYEAKSSTGNLNDNKLFLALDYNATNQALAESIRSIVNKDNLHISIAWRANRNLGSILRNIP